MSTGRPPGDNAPPAAPWVSRVCAGFERAWQAGERPRLEDLLADMEGAERSLLLRELLRLEVALRHRGGEQPTAEEYRRRFPELRAWIDALPDQGGAPADLATVTRFAEGPAMPPPVPEAVTATDPQVTREASRPAPSSADVQGLVDLPGYDRLGEVGRGGMGIVYRAHDRKRHQTVALKVMSQVGSSSLYRFKQEFRALADVVHPNLVQLYELIADGPQWFFTMELIEGVHFLAHVRPGAPAPPAASTTSLAGAPPAAAAEAPAELPSRAGPPFQEGRLRAALRQLADGLCALHAAGKLHRDLKPSNVLVSATGRVVILDFGLAAELDQRGLHESAEHHLLGTVAYMSPEQAAGDPVSPASDWYSVGVMLYEALTGQRPFRGTVLQILRAKEQREPPPPRQLVPDVPEDLGALCVALLRRQPGERSCGREVLSCLGGQAAAAGIPSPFPQPAPTALIGRRRHLQALDDAFEAAGQGRTVVVGVSGRSGTGKSTLLHRFIEELTRRQQAVAEFARLHDEDLRFVEELTRRQQAVVLTGRCYEQESVPYKALDSLVDALSGYLRPLPAAEVEAVMPRDVLSLARVFPVLRHVEAVSAAPRRAEVSDPNEVRRCAFAALRELLARLGDRQRLVLAIDDLQWGDVDSAALLAELLRPPEAPALLLLACYRSEETATSPFLRAFLPALEKAGAGLDHRELTVEALTPDEARDLSLALFGGAGGTAARSRAEAVARESGGNPLFVHELVQNLQAGGSSPGEAISLDEVLWARVQRLPVEARRLLETVAVAAGPLDQALACRVAELADERGALALLRVGRLVRSTGPAEHNDIETYHDRIRETVVAHLPTATLREHHHGLALALEASGLADPESLAQHFQGAGVLAKAGEYFAQAAAQAADALAFDRAAKLYRLALEVRPVAGEEGRRLRAQLGDALANAGRGAEAAQQYLEGAAGAPTEELLELQKRAATQFLISGHIDQGIAILRTVLQAVGMELPRTPRRALVSLLLRRLWLRWRGFGFSRRDAGEVPPEELRLIDICWSVAVGLSVVDNIRGADFQVRHLLLALRAGEPSRIARSLALEAGHRATAGPKARSQAERLLKTARELAQQIGNPHALGMTALMEGLAIHMQGRWKAALPFCEEAETILRDRCTGVWWERATVEAVRFFSLHYMGEVAELNRRWPSVVASAESRGDLYASATLGVFLGPMLRLAADDPVGARQALHHFRGQWSQPGFHIQHMHALQAQLHIDLYGGEGDMAWQRLTAAWPALAGAFLLRVQGFRFILLAIRAQSALAAEAKGGDPRLLLDSARRAVRRLWRENRPDAEALAQFLRAGLAVARADLPGAKALLADAAGRLDAVDMGLYAAAARRRLGELCDGDMGRELVARADAWMTAQEIRNPARLTAMLLPGRFPSA